jgi:hypothetical protein
MLKIGLSLSAAARLIRAFGCLLIPEGEMKMKAQKPIVLSAICICLFLNFFLSSASLRGQSLSSLQWGTTIDGLQMSISIADSGKTDVPEFQVALHNAGEKDVTLNLGMMLANGKVQLPTRISFNVTDSTGKIQRFDFSDPKHGFVAGRVDDYIVPLRANSIYTLIIRSDQLWSPDSKEFGLKLAPGKYQITTQFEGSGAKANNLDTPGIKLMNFWSGKLQSNALTVEK